LAFSLLWTSTFTTRSQRITEAIASVIGIDVMVIDEDLERVAGAGEMRL